MDHAGGGDGEGGTGGVTFYLDWGFRSLGGHLILSFTPKCPTGLSIIPATDDLGITVRCPHSNVLVVLDRVLPRQVGHYSLRDHNLYGVSVYGVAWFWNQECPALMFCGVHVSSATDFFKFTLVLGLPNDFKEPPFG